MCLSEVEQGGGVGVEGEGSTWQAITALNMTELDVAPSAEKRVCVDNNLWNMSVNWPLLCAIVGLFKNCVFGQHLFTYAFLCVYEDNGQHMGSHTDEGLLSQFGGTGWMLPRLSSCSSDRWQALSGKKLGAMNGCMEWWGGHGLRVWGGSQTLIITKPGDHYLSIYWNIYPLGLGNVPNKYKSRFMTRLVCISF